MIQKDEGGKRSCLLYLQNLTKENRNELVRCIEKESL